MAAGQAAQQAQQQAMAQAPPPDVLYNNALRDYNAAKNDLAKQEFSDYVKFYPNTDLAGNAYFYLAELAYKQGNFQDAVNNYDQVLQNFPTGNKAASSDLKKGSGADRTRAEGRRHRAVTARDPALSAFERGARGQGSAAEVGGFNYGGEGARGVVTGLMISVEPPTWRGRVVRKVRNPVLVCSGGWPGR